MLVKTTKERIESITSEHSDQDIIRSALIAELDATSLYVSQVDNLNNLKAKEVITHILGEEKEHIAELYCLLNSLDEEQALKPSNISPDTCIMK